MKSYFLIGISGAAGAGKTTLAGAVAEQIKILNRGIWVEKAKFAAPIYDAIGELEIDKECHPKLFRDLAQLIGGRCREDNPEFFVRLFERHYGIRAGYHEGSGERVILIADDVRHANESAICDLHVKVITTRPSKLTAEQQSHESESNWESLPADITVAMNSMDDLDAARRTIVNLALAGLERKAAA